MALKIIMDADEQGGFTVEGDIHQEQIPAGWIEDTPGHFKPGWPPCRYRRLNTGSEKGKIRIETHCILFKEVVPYEICSQCELHEPPFKPDNNPPEDVAKYLEVLPTRLEMPGYEWKPCIFRKRQKPPDSCCYRMVCQCQECPLKDQVVMLTDCRECSYAQGPPPQAVGDTAGGGDSTN